MAFTGPLAALFFFSSHYELCVPAAGNRIVGSLPDALVNLPGLRVLQLDNNVLVATLPAALMRSKTLRQLSLVSMLAQASSGLLRPGCLSRFESNLFRRARDQ